MSKTLYSLINPIVKFVLSSPLHGLMSHNTVLLEFQGRKSGRTYTMPVSYQSTGDQVHCFTDRNNKWWQNLRDGNEVRLTIRGRKHVGKPAIFADGGPRAQSALRDFLIAVPRDASHAGVALDAAGRPVDSEIESASERLVFISIAISN